MENSENIRIKRNFWLYVYKNFQLKEDTVLYAFYARYYPVDDKP